MQNSCIGVSLEGRMCVGEMSGNPAGVDITISTIILGPLLILIVLLLGRLRALPAEPAAEQS